ncbi:hypothetical protein CABS03_11970 [Colletotrichum abscissum]|uniref:Uncharacterized protein n=2 Tax=Colletotrichum acutatum species complex TaxID=2707335 RepID=A0A9Q0B519_9PEZI|nr:uncharacterized protein CCOS01_08920 [Colletotrichum costaricense]KAI3557385.1 hypothetical protein CABS02_02489 [Colletotrichum abscissum]KAK1523833.1 hypothetical protein CCOS01_08920 [Colletotrichum costaricense]
MGHNVGNGIHFPGRPGVTPDQRTMDHADEGGIVSGRFRVARQSCRLDYRVANANPRRPVAACKLQDGSRTALGVSKV